MNVLDLYAVFFGLLSKNHKKNLIWIFVISSVSATTEVGTLSIISIIISNIVTGANIYSGINQSLNLDLSFSLVLFFTALLVIISMVLSVVSVKLTSHLAASIASDICTRMFRGTLSLNYEKILEIGSTEIAKNISIEIQRLTLGFILPAISLIPRLFLLVALVIGIVLIGGIKGIAPIFVLGTAYLFIYWVIKPRLKINDIAITSGYSELLKIAKSGLGSSAELKILELTRVYEQRLSAFVQQANTAHASNVVLQNAPRYVVESCIYLLIIAAMFALNVSEHGLTPEVVSLVSMLGLGALKLLPTLQQVYMLVSLIKGHETSANIAKDYTSNKTAQVEYQYLQDGDVLMELRSVCVEGLHGKPRLHNISISLPTTGHLGLVGKSGSGKSTLLKVIAGLIPPDSGTIRTVQRKNKLRIGYIPQSVYIMHGSFFENITYQNSFEEVDKEAYEQAIIDADLEELYKQLGKDPYAQLQEAGENISGGQRQRIGIARALYRKSDLLLCDEITSSLDAISEKNILDTLNNLSKDRTIISVMHKQEIFHNCSTLIQMSEGMIIDCKVPYYRYD